MGNLYNTHEQQYTRVSSIKNHQRWYYEDNNGVYQPYDVATSQWLNKASVGASTTIQYSNRTYSIRKVSHNECKQKNTKTGFIRKGFIRKVKGTATCGCT
eukprot:278682_1